MREPAKLIQGGSTPSGTFYCQLAITCPFIHGCNVQK